MSSMPDALTSHIILNHERDFIQMLHILKCYIKTQVSIYGDFTLEASIDTRGACHIDFLCLIIHGTALTAITVREEQ